MTCPFCNAPVDDGADNDPAVTVEGGLRAHARCVSDAKRPYSSPVQERNFRERVGFSDRVETRDAANAELKSVNRELRD